VKDRGKERIKGRIGGILCRLVQGEMEATTDILALHELTAKG
jgi:hypothetical protein